MRPPLLRHPGAAKWVLLHGPSFPTLLPMIDEGIRCLQRAGFGERTGMAFATLFNHAIMTLAIADDRLLDEGDGTRDHDEMMRRFRDVGAASQGVAVLDATLMSSFGAADSGQAREHYYRFVIDTTIAGLASILTHRASRSPGPAPR